MLSGKSRSEDVESAESLALRVLGFVLADDRYCAIFLAQTGLDAAGLRAGAADPAFLGGVLDFLLQDDEMTCAFCQSVGLAPDAPAQARLRLPGAPVEW